MAEIPKVKPRDMVALTGIASTTHEQIHQGIRERAAQHEAYVRARDEKLNAESAITRKA